MKKIPSSIATGVSVLCKEPVSWDLEREKCRFAFTFNISPFGLDAMFFQKHGQIAQAPQLLIELEVDTYVSPGIDISAICLV